MMTRGEISKYIRDCYADAACIDTTTLTSEELSEYHWAMDALRKHRTLIEGRGTFSA